MNHFYFILLLVLLHGLDGFVFGEEELRFTGAISEPRMGEQNLIDISERSSLPIYTMILHSGVKTDFSDFRGKCLIVSFAYTTCKNPNKCTAVTQNMSLLQEKLKKLEQSDDVFQLLLSYDSKYDSLDDMKMFADKHGYKLGERALYAKPEQKFAEEFFKSLGAKVSFNSSGVSIHDIHALIIDREGRIAKVYTKILWDNDKMVDQLSEILKEPYVAPTNGD
jgi:cytochrome oxidase Cu insertion factor (SCO1/SenC/PrrC family)